METLSTLLSILEFSRTKTELVLCEGNLKEVEWCGVLMFYLLLTSTNFLTTSRFDGDSRHHDSHVTSMFSSEDRSVSCQIRKIAGCACAGNAGNVSPRGRLQGKSLVSDSGMHHGTCRDACRDRLPAVAEKTLPAFSAHAHPQFYVSGKRPIG